MKKRITALEKRVSQIKTELTNLGDMRPGSISTQSRSWGGQYCQLSYTHQGKGHTEYIQKENTTQVEQQIKNYKKFKALTKEWIDIAIQLAKIEAPKNE